MLTDDLTPDVMQYLDLMLHYDAAPSDSQEEKELGWKLKRLYDAMTDTDRLAIQRRGLEMNP